MNTARIHAYRSEGSGHPDRSRFRTCGAPVIIEEGVRVFHPETISLGNNVYIGHDTILKGYYNSSVTIGDNVWIGQGCFIHGAGGLTIGCCVGIGPHVKMHGAYHLDEGTGIPILFQPLGFEPIIVEDDVNIGIGAMIMHGVMLRRGTRVGANAVVTRSFPPNSVIAGVPARLLRQRECRPVKCGGGERKPDAYEGGELGPSDLAKEASGAITEEKSCP
jgi:acetyltransferase-like isoleucine patch superfamily enzyme